MGQARRPSNLQRITELGIQFHLAGGEEKERLSIKLMRCFHPYPMKRLDMILRGHLPRYGSKINTDSKKLLQYLMPKGTPVNKATLTTACKHLHLAFKGYEPEEIYSVLASCLIKVISKYDPFYVDKVKAFVTGPARPAATSAGPGCLF